MGIVAMKLQEMEKKNCGNQGAEIIGEEGVNLMGIVVMKLPKMEKKKRNCGNQVVEIGEKRREKN